MLAEHFKTMLQYNRWANRLVLDKTALVSPEDYYASVPGLSFGSLHATLVHTLTAEIVWVARFRGELPPEQIKDARAAHVHAVEYIPSFEALSTLWQSEDEKQVQFIEALTDEQAESPLVYRTQYGEPNEQPLHEVMGHFVNHGTQFRTEAAVRLTQLGLSPGDLDLIIYLRQR
jgi:uncharacterized damage-inducible protein DinB